MGAWGTRPWESDAALDYAQGLVAVMVMEFPGLIEAGNDEEVMARLAMIVAVAKEAGLQMSYMVESGISREGLVVIYDWLVGSARERWRQPEARIAEVKLWCFRVALLLDLQDAKRQPDITGPWEDYIAAQSAVEEAARGQF